MRRNPTLPTIRQSNTLSSAKAKQGVQTFRKIEDKINCHDQQIVKNEKIISNLANQFRMLKEQLQFEQQYNQKYKSSVSKYQQETSKHLKVIRDQKQVIIKLEHLNKEKEKNLDLLRQQKQQLKSYNEELAQSFEELSRENKKKDVANKQVESQLEKAKKDIKQKQLQIKRKQEEFREAFGADRQIRQTKVKKLQKDLELANLYIQNSKEAINLKDKEIHRLNMQIFQFEDKLKTSQKNQIKIKTMVEDMKLMQKESEDLGRKLKESEQHVRNLQVMIKTQQSKSNTSTNEKMKNLQQEKKELNEKIDKMAKQIEQTKRKVQGEKKQREKLQKKQLQTRQSLQKLQVFQEKINKSKGQINQQLSKLKTNIMCDFCSKPMKNPVTNIPCGHSYCQQCKNGYLKQCKKCAGVKREAVYRNQLLDQIITASNLIQKIVILINN